MVIPENLDRAVKVLGRACKDDGLGGTVVVTIYKTEPSTISYSVESGERVHAAWSDGGWHEHFRPNSPEQDAENIARDACAWIRDNPTGFKALMAVAHRQVDEGNPCTKQGELESYARKMGMKVDVVDVFAFNRTLYPALSRYMVMLRPRLARTINFRKSKLDDIDLAAIWHEVVNPSTAFLAQSRMEAEHLVEVGDVSAA